jgi:Bacterial DNA-binding protein
MFLRVAAGGRTARKAYGPAKTIYNRFARTPATGEAIKIKASKKVAFRAANELKLAV